MPKLTFTELVDSKGYIKYLSEDVVSKIQIPNDNPPIEFFKLDSYVSDLELEKEYETRGLVPAHPYNMLSLDMDILDAKKYVGTHWKDENGKWCFASFARFPVGRYVDVGCDGRDWFDGWWFAGVRKSDIGTSDTNSSSDTLSLDHAIKIVKQAGLEVVGQVICETCNGTGKVSVEK